MKKKGKTKDSFRKQGSITYNGKKIDILIDRKTTELRFEEDGRTIVDPQRLEAVFNYLKEANKEQ